MSFFSAPRLKTGVEISSDKITAALILKKKDNFSIKKLSDVKIPAGTLKPSFKKENILNPEALHDCLKKACYDMNLKKISVALPDSSVKVFVRKFTQLPEDPQEINEMVLWNFSSSLNLPAEQLRVSWENMGKNQDNHHIFLIVLGLEKIMVQYETAFKKIGVSPVILLPAGLNQFNFYCKSLPEKGTVAYLGLFDDFLNIFVFSNGVPVFYKMIKQGFWGNDSTSAINNVDLLIQYYNSENPDLTIEKFFIASHIKSDMLMEHILQDVSQIGSHIKSDMLMEHILQDGNPVDCTIIDERQLIDFDEKFKIDFKKNPLPFYTSALGAAQGL
jgi:hypothetical protein